jgi:hypothetical protein
LEPWAEDFSKLEFNESERTFFNEEWKLHWGRYCRKYFVFNEPWRFVLRVKPNMITKVRARDEIMEARMKSIDNYLERNNLEWRQIRLLNGNCKWRHRYWEKPNEIYRFKNWSIEKILDDIKEEQ